MPRTDGNGPERLDARRLGALVSANSNANAWIGGGGTLEDRLQRKLGGEDLEDICGDGPSLGADGGRQLRRWR